MSDTQQTVPGLTSPDDNNLSARRSRWPVWLVLAVVLGAAVVGIPVGIAAHEASGYFLFSPGTAPVITMSDSCKPAGGELALPDGAPCVRLVLPQGKTHPVDGELLMVDVEVAQAGPLDWAEYELGLLGNSRQMVPIAAYAGTTPTSELACQDTQEMVSADQDAALAALSQLRYKVDEKPLGVQIDTVYTGTPAWAAGLKCNDVITAVNSKPVRTAEQLTTALQALRPGNVVSLTDQPAGSGRAKQVKVKLSAPTASALAEGFTGHAYLGLEVETKVKPVLPFPVSVDAGAIGGPSAGLAFTLGILDALSNGRLTGGHKVAATGTIDPDGNVGQVGGVQEKTVAVERAGAQVFFVPQAEYSDAKSVAGDGLNVVPVTTLGQVLETLQQHYGGDLSGLNGVAKA
ncbi:MAG TPA: S16 family serine protease [Acidimicrobiales bacterium]|nr:S16 family serine protease [Acidimicrobiales bacterium]